MFIAVLTRALLALSDINTFHNLLSFDSLRLAGDEGASYLRQRVSLLCVGTVPLCPTHITCGPSDLLVHGKSAVISPSSGSNPSDAPVLWAVKAPATCTDCHNGPPPDLKQFTIHGT
jgi:hypothetical protein